MAIKSKAKDVEVVRLGNEAKARDWTSLHYAMGKRYLVRWKAGAAKTDGGKLQFQLNKGTNKAIVKPIVLGDGSWKGICVEKHETTFGARLKAVFWARERGDGHLVEPGIYPFEYQVVTGSDIVV